MESLYEIGKRLNNDKITQHGYHRFYPFFFEEFRNENIKLLEIGIHIPAPFNIWREYFPNATLYGIEILDIDPSKIPYNSLIFKGDQNDETFLETVVKSINSKVDIIIDDGSHHPEHQINTFDYLFTNLLKDGGIYVIEDIETNYWKNGKLYGNSIKCGWKNENSIIEIFKGLVDTSINEEFLCCQHLSDENYDKIKYIMNDIEMITFGYNCIFIVKKKSEYQEYYDRVYRFLDYVI